MAEIWSFNYYEHPKGQVLEKLTARVQYFLNVQIRANICILSLSLNALSLAGVLQSVGIYISCWNTEMLLLQMTWLSRSISGAVFSVSGTQGLLCPLSYANSPLCA